MNYHDGALIEPTSVGTAVVKKAEPRAEDVVVVLGAEMVGLGTIAKFKDTDIPKLIACDVSEKRRNAAKILGADITVDPTKDDVIELVMKETSGIGADIVVEATGKPITFLQSIDMVRNDGKIMGSAIYEESFEFNPSLARTGKPMTSLVRKGIRMIGCYDPDIPASFELIKTGKVKAGQLVTHVFPLDKIKEAFETQMDAGESVKVMIEP